MWDVNNYLLATLEIMNEHGIQIRDTYLRKNGQNLDDLISNNRFHGPKLFKIEWSETVEWTQLSSSQMYPVVNHRAVAYDAAVISVPNRFKDNNRDDQIIHECVHFLQHNTEELDKSYIQYNGTNYIPYVLQRAENEAHIVQITYIVSNQSSHLYSNFDEKTKSKIIDLYSAFKQNSTQENSIKLLIESKSRGVL